MSVHLYTVSDQPLRLGPKLGTGGEGTVYEIAGAPELVAKLYHESITDERAAKLAWLARNGSERLSKLTAWPVDVVCEQPGGRVAGFTMKRIGQAEEVHALHSPKSRLQKFPEASWAFLLYVAANVARAVAAVHEHGLVVGDLNPKNILVTRQATVHLLDCDSFQVRVEDTVYRCEAGFPDYTPPELQGVAFRDVDRTAAHDAFGLGVVIFQLLFLGRHPFSGRFTGSEEMPLERAIREGRFAYGSDAGQRGMQPPPGTLALEAVSEPVMKLLRRAFLYVPDDRPQPREWVTALEALAQTLKRCEAHDGHQFYQELAACPWCEIETRARVRLFNFALTGKQQAQGYFRLADVWREVESVAPPRVPALPNRYLLGNLAPSSEAEALEQEKQSRFRRTWLAAIPAGLAVAWLTKSEFPLWQVSVFAIFAENYMSWGNGFVNKRYRRKFSKAKNLLLEPFEQKKQTAEEWYNELDKRWQQEASDSQFHVKLEELETRKLAYENLASARAQRLAQLADEARTTQLQFFLRQHFLRAKDLKGIGENTAVTLHAHGIQTAADIEKPRLKAVPGIGGARAQTLLDWRRTIEQQFVFDAQRAVPPQTRLKVEREFDETRVRLERDLLSGAGHLRRLQQKMNKSQEVLFEPLLTAQRTLAQAELDLEVVKKKKPLWPVIIVLLLSFWAGSWVEDFVKDYTRYSPAVHEPIKSVELPPPPPKPLMTDLSPDQQASQLYHEGVSLLQREQYSAAVERFEKVVALKAAFEAEAYQGLGEAFQRIGKYKESIQATQRSLQLRESAEAYQTLGLAHLGLKDWASAKTAFQNVAKVNGTSDWERGYWQAHYNLVRTTQVLKESQTELAALEMFLADNPDLIEERFQLAALQALSDKQVASRQNLAVLKTKHPPAAEALRRLLRTR
jgi:DNA-binding helix-hairpin-helix protein with protein kinase domain